jgi:RNA polymerase sigma-70 factor (ECF subfamily)
MEAKGPRSLALGDVELLSAVARGEPASVRVLLDDHLPVVYGFVLARVGGDEAVAEDLMQETLIEGVKSAHSFRGESSLATWLCAIARRRVARHYERERKQEAAARGLELVRDEPEPDLEAEWQRRDEVIRALGALSAMHRQVLVLKYLDGLSVEEIGHEIGRPRVQVQSLLQRARESFRRQIGDVDG